LSLDGKGRTPWPARDEQLVIQDVGPALAADLIPAIKELSRDFHSSDAYRRVEDLVEMGQVAAEEFRSRHPEISEDAVKALAWCYMYDYK
jgi:hypothetical protein